MYELDGKDWRLRVERNGFADAIGPYMLSVRILKNQGRSWTYDAYAPLPMVLETTLKGRSLGRGLSWDCCIAIQTKTVSVKFLHQQVEIHEDAQSEWGDKTGDQLKRFCWTLSFLLCMNVLSIQVRLSRVG